MSTYSEIDDEKLSFSDMPDELFKKVRRSAGLLSQKGDIYHGQGTEKRSRREIANCNERRRMQSINSGFESLKTLLPTEDGEKLSKAAILQLTSKYIQHLVGENRRMRDQLSQIQQQQTQQQQQQPQAHRHTDLLLAASDVALRKRKLPAAPDDSDGGGGGGVYIGYFHQQGNHTIIRPQQQQQQQHPTFHLAVKPDYEQFVVEPAIQQQQQQQQQLPQQLQPKPKRLEHLMMAIERIEGQSNQQQQQQQRHPSPLPSVDSRPQQKPQQPAIMISPFTPHDDIEEVQQPELHHQQQQQPHHLKQSAASSAASSLSIRRDIDLDDLSSIDDAPGPRIFVVDIANASMAAAAAAAAAAADGVPSCAGAVPSTAAAVGSSSSSSTPASSSPDSPAPCRPRSIPHKYLHRPQVIQANRST